MTPRAGLFGPGLLVAAALTWNDLAQAQPASAPIYASAFLTANAHAPGVHVLPSGLQYKVVQSGPPGGPSPQIGDIMKLDYQGSLTNGAVFDSSYARGKPAIMQLAHLVPAWMEALPLMHVGDEWVLYAPPELGYGDEKAGSIPAGSVLIFRVKLLGVGTPN